MKNNIYTFEYMKKTNTVETSTKLGRNDPCHCGSGRKYKSCCMRKDQEEELVKERLQQVETVSDKYFTVKEYIELSGQPVTKFDFLLLEFLNITADTLDKYNKTTTAEAKAIIRELYIYVKKFLKVCLDCEHKCLREPFKNVSFKSLIDEGVNISELPKALQKGTSMNFFYIEFINAFCATLEVELLKTTNKEIASEIATYMYWTLADYVADNCYERCENECIVEQGENAYCKFCTFGSKRLLCPKDGEISYEAIGALETDMIH